MGPVLVTICYVLLTFGPAIAMAQGAGVGSASPVSVPSVAAATSPPAAAASIPVGTIISAQNWNQYRDFMPDGMIKLFAGEYSLKMPADVQMEIGPTVIHPLPKGYLEATEKYSGQIKLVELPD